MRAGPQRGFTLVEMVTVVAILGILATLTIGGMQGLSARSGPVNASQDLLTIASSAKLRALSSGNDVWLIVYPGLARSGGEGLGAYYVFEDRVGDFLAHGYSDFSPDNTAPVSQSRLQESVFLEDYSPRGVRFAPTDGAKLPAPFNLDVNQPCSFCTAGGRGAVIFAAEGSARFVDGSGAGVPGSAHFLALRTTGPRPAYALAIGRATGFLGLYPLDQ